MMEFKEKLRSRIKEIEDTSLSCVRAGTNNDIDINTVKDIIVLLRTAEQERDQYKAELDKNDRILRSSAPEEYKNCASSIGAIQNYIVDMEKERDKYKEVIVEIGQKIKTIQDGADGLVKIWKERCEDFIAENNRLKAELESLRAKIKEAQEQEPVAEVYKNAMTGTGIDIALTGIVPDGVTKLYAAPIIPD